MKKALLPLALSSLTVPVAPASASDLNLTLELPRLNVAEYHRPYVAIWLEKPDQSVAANLAVWYDLKKKNQEGEKWLHDLRQWWRRSGRELNLPIDGLSGATRTAGEQKISFNAEKSGLDKLPAGDYKLVIETARESGGRELLKLPVKLPLTAGQAVQAQGEHEIGAVSIAIK
jgi:hypothetical protein